MARMSLSLATLKDFDAGKAAIAWQKALERAVRDCLDRAADPTARKVTLTASIKPILEQDGDVLDADVDFAIAVKLPAWTTKPRPTAIDSKGGRLLFNDLAPDNPHQMTIDEE